MPKTAAWKPIVLEHQFGTFSTLIKGPISLQHTSFVISQEQRLMLVSSFGIWDIIKAKFKLLFVKD